MTSILFTLFIFFLAVTLVIIIGDTLLQKNKKEEWVEQSGHDAFMIACFALLRIAKRKLSQIRRLILAYVLHVSVRILRIFDRVSFFLYAKSRNLFIKNAVKHKGTVPFFWEYLKTYKQEIDREREFLLKEEE